MGTGFFNAAKRPEKEPSRPRFVNPRTQLEQTWQRASNFAAPIESPFGLIKHQTRQVVRGFNVRNDLARMALAGAIEGDKVDEVISTALSAAEDEAKANNGTAVHAALGLCDTGREVPEEFLPHARGYVAELKIWGLRPVAIEQRILNTRLGATGTFDRVYVTESGRYLIGDIKTGRVDHAHKFAVQCEVYSGGDFIVHPDGRTEPVPWPLDRDAALLIHVDPETGATSIYEVPLRLARWGAALAEQVRAFQRADVLLPYSGVPAGPLAEQLRREAVQAIGAAEPVYSAAETAQAGRDIVAEALGMDEEDKAAVRQHIADATEAAQASGPSIVAGVDLDQRAAARGTEAAQPAAVSDGALTEAEQQSAAKLGVEGGPEYVRRMLALLIPKNDKAKLQRMYADLGGTDLAHHRKWLADAIIRLQNSLSSGPPVAAEIAQTAEQGVPSAEATPFMLKQISEAETVADIERIRGNLIAASGKAAWSPAMNEVAIARIAELDQPAAAPDTSPLSRIADAESTQDLARVWDEVTENGAKLARWTPAYDKAAREKSAELTAAQQVNPNPWGSQ